MRTSRLALTLAALNLALLLTLLARSGGTAAPERAPGILRGRGLELVDEAGRVRAKFDVESSGEGVLRLMDDKGAIRVKLGAGRDGSGLVLLDDATEVGMQLLAKKSGTRLVMARKGGTKKVLEP